MNEKMIFGQGGPAKVRPTYIFCWYHLNA